MLLLGSLTAQEWMENMDSVIKDEPRCVCATYTTTGSCLHLPEIKPTFRTPAVYKKKKENTFPQLGPQSNGNGTKPR